MDQNEIQARAAIAAALIATGKYNLDGVEHFEHQPSGHNAVKAIRTAVDVIYRGLMNPK